MFEIMYCIAISLCENSSVLYYSQCIFKSVSLLFCYLLFNKIVDRSIEYIAAVKFVWRNLSLQSAAGGFWQKNLLTNGSV